MQVKELRSKTVEELQKLLSSSKEEQLKKRCNLVTLQLDNYNLISSGRKDIARIKTVINEKLKERNGRN